MITLICGLPNAGKTTYSARYSNVIHIDEVRSKKALEMVKTTSNVCIDGVFAFSGKRKEFLDAYGGDGKKVCIWLNTPYDACVKRENRNRSRVIIDNCHKLFEPPTYDEGWDEIIIIEDNNEQSINNEK